MTTSKGTRAVVDVALLVLGTVGYALAFMQVGIVRVWLGSRGRGWPSVLLSAMVALLANMAILFYVSLASRLGWLRGMTRYQLSVVSHAIVVGLVLIPWMMFGWLVAILVVERHHRNKGVARDDRANGDLPGAAALRAIVRWWRPRGRR